MLNSSSKLLGGALLLSLSAAASAQAPAVAAAAQYRIVQTVALGSPDGWDYVVDDPSAHRVYVSHADRVTVVDDRNGTILGEVSGLPGGTHGVAIATAQGRGYTDEGRAGVADSFDLKSLKVVHRITADKDADAVAYDPVSGHVFVVDGDPGIVTVIDPKTDSVVASPTLGSALEYAVAGGDGKLYVNSVEKHEIVRLDTATNTVDAHWPMSQCERPHGLAVDTRTHRLFSSCSNSTLIVMSASNGQQLAALPIGKGSDAVAFDPKRNLVFSSNGQDGTLSVIRENGDGTFSTAGTVPTAMTARTMSINVDTGRLYLVAAEIDSTRPAVAAAPPPGAPAAGGPPRMRPNLVPGSLKLLMLDPQP